jgi:hypothetical protein
MSKHLRQKLILVLACVFCLVAVLYTAAMQEQRPSPAAQTSCKFQDGKTITVAYSSPRMKGRKIFGGLVPYGEVWRTGANEATTFVNTAGVSSDGKTIPAGNYTIFTLPKEDTWTLIVSKKTGEWGIPYPGEGSDLVRMEMKTSKVSSPVEDFTIAFDNSGQACTMRVEWETTRASIRFGEAK